MSDRSAGDDVPTDLLRSALAAVEDLFVVCDAEGRLRHWNRAVVEVTGYADADLESMAFADLFTADDAERVGDAVARALDEGEATVEATLPTSDGAVPYEFRTVRLTDESGELLGIAGVGRDVLERERIRHERRALLDRMTDAFFAVDENWQLTYVNERARTILSAAMGRESEADLEGLHLWEEIPEAVGTPFYEIYSEAMNSQESQTLTEYYEPLDTWFEVRAYPSETGLSVYFRDVTERRRQQAAIEERERVLREIHEVTSDPDRAFDEQVRRLLDIGRDVIGTDYGTLSRISGEDYEFQVVSAADDSVRAGDTVPLGATNCERTAATEETLVLSDVARDAPELTDRAGYREWGIACYLGAPVMVDGEVHGTFCFYDDEPREDPFSGWEITLVDLLSQWVSYELTHREARERLERENERLEEFASIVSHDLRNPLNVLQGSLEMAADSGDSEHFERCERAVQRMDALIDDLLTLARAGEWVTDPRPVELAAAARESWEAVAATDATLTVETDRRVMADSDRLKQLLENLFRNAVEHGSTSSRPEADEAVEHGSTSPGSQARQDAVEHGGESVTVTVGDAGDGFYVADDGPGIPEAEREQVFESGYSTADDGTGFGLNIVRRIADAHGWDVRIVDSEGGGARFEFSGVETG